MKRLLTLAVMMIGTVYGCGDSTTGPSSTKLDTTLREHPGFAWGDTASATNVKWKMLSKRDLESGRIEVDGSMSLTLQNRSNRPILMSQELRFFDDDGLLVAEGSQPLVVELSEQEIRDIISAFTFEAGDVRTANSIATLQLVASFEFLGLGLACMARVDSTYDPWNYLAWRDSRNSRFSSITHALPCSAYVKAAPSSVPVPDAIRVCPDAEKQLYYDLIGRYDQFIAGWEDIVDARGNRVEFTEVDSAENFASDIRTSYVEECVPE